MKRLCVCSLALLVLALLAKSHAADIDVIRDFLNIKIPGRLPSWNAADISNYCNWFGIKCDAPQGHITEFILSANSTNRYFQGTMPQSIMSLTHIRVFTVDGNPLVGVFPREFWLKPTLAFCVVSGTAMTVSLPPVLPDNLIVVGAADTIFNESLPDANWNTLQAFDMLNTELRCPLSQSFVNYWMQPRPAFSLLCRMARTHLYVDSQNRLCGQLPVSKLQCELYPLISRPDLPPNSVPLFVGDYQNLTVEFYETKVYFYKAYYKNGIRMIYRDEYGVLLPSPLTERVERENPFGLSYNTATGTGFHKIAWTSPSVLTASMNISIHNGTMPADLIFDFNPPAKPNRSPQFVKFSVRIKNIGVKWTNSSVERPVLLPFTIFFKAAHSPRGGPVIDCTRGNFFETCRSSVATMDLSVIAFTDDPFSKIEYSTQTMRFEYSYGLVGSIDGVPMDLAKVDATIIKFFSSVGNIDIITLHQLANSTKLIDSRIEDEKAQSVAFAAMIRIQRFNEEMIYDPDISISLLFDPGAESAPAINDVSSAAFSVGAAIGITLGILVAIAGIGLFAKFVFPYMRRRKSSLSSVAAEGYDDKEAEMSPKQQLVSEAPTTKPTTWTTTRPTLPSS